MSSSHNPRSEAAQSEHRGQSSGDSRRKSHPTRRRWIVGLVAVVAVLLILQLVASPIAKAVVNRKLSALPGYLGRAEGVSVAFWRGAVEVSDLSLSERGHEQDPPLLHVKKASMRLAPGALFTGKLGGAATIDGLELNVIKRERVPDVEEAADKAQQELAEVKEDIKRWQDVLRESFPMSLTRLEVTNGRFHFIDRSYQPAVDVALNNIHIVATDLQNRPKANGGTMPARVEMTAESTGNGKFKMTVQLDPVAQQPHFALNFELREQSLPPLNSFLLAYADADVSRGTFELYSEVNAQDGAYDGYVKPLFHDLDFDTASDGNKNLGDRLKETVVDAVTSVLENEEQDQVATRAPFAGNFAQNDLDIWTTIVNLLRNAFIQAIRGGLEGQTAG